MSDFKRARKPQEIELRRAHLLKTARINLESGLDLNRLTLNGLAKKAGMAKSNVYRYFETREALLLALLWDEWGAWYQAVSGKLSRKSSPKTNPLKLIKYLSRSLSSRSLLCALTAALPSVVEANLSEKAIYDFKRQSLVFFKDMGQFLESIGPGLSSKQYTQLMYDMACLLAGLYPHGHPAKPVVKVLRAPELSFFRRDFPEDLERFMVALTKDAMDKK